jgi:hypothetical protein
MKQFNTSILIISSLFLATAAQAQVTFSIGPKVGYSLSTASFHVSDYPDYFSTFSSYRSGVEAGVLAQIGFGDHWAVQPALLYARKAPSYGTSSYYQPNNYGYHQQYTLGLNYLLLPINVLYSQRANGQGKQMFIGPYMGWLLSGTYRVQSNEGRGEPKAGGPAYDGTVEAGDTYVNSSRYAIRGLDAGLQMGVGYGLGALQLQASFSLGLRNVGAAYAPNALHDYEAPVIRTRGFQLSAAYLFGPKS